MPNQIGFEEFVDDKWQKLTYADLGVKIASLQQHLQTLNVKRGDRVAILLKNGTDWVACEQASLGLDLIVVPLYIDDRAKSIAYNIAHSESKILFIDNSQRYNKIKDELPAEIKVVFLDRMNFKSNITPVKPSDIPVNPATIVYTSGTLGKPKGVMLSHENIIENVKALTSYMTFLVKIDSSPFCHYLTC